MALRTGSLLALTLMGASILPAQEGRVMGPGAGLVFDTVGHKLRPVRGIPGASVNMGNNGCTVSGNTPNVAGPATAKPESKGPFGRKVNPLTPFSQKQATPVGVVDDDAFGNNEVGG